jgi:formate/nitrite transporter FocA (FNT family)
VLNIVGGTLLIIILTVHGVLPHGAGNPLRTTAYELQQNGPLGAFMSAIVGGALITLMTWLVEGAESMGVRIVTAWLSGTLLALGVMNHVIVATLELIFGVRYGANIAYGDVISNFFVAAAGNLIGGVLLVTLTRTGQAKGSGGGRT